MNQLPDKPNGSVIEQLASPAGVTLRWPLPSAGPGRYVVAAFLAVWLCLWAIALADASSALGRDRNVDPDVAPLAWFCLGVWIFGGIVMMGVLWVLVRPERPEAVRLEAERLRYLPGRTLMAPGVRDFDRPREALAALAAATPPPVVPRSAIRAFVLERAEERQQLCLDLGTERREIGASLTEPDREWLYAALRRWHSPNQPLQQTGRA